MIKSVRNTVAGLFLLTLCACKGPVTPVQVQSVLTDVQIACESEVLATSVIPAGTPVATVAADIAAGCGIATSLIPDLEQVVTAFMASTTRAPAPAGAVYTPSPRVIAARAVAAKAGKP
jgi:hypothetical protein